MARDDDNSRETIMAALILGFIWAVLGMAAFITSIICFGRSGSFGQQVMGLIIATLFGPFYWIYFTYVENYCKPLRGGRSRM